MSVSYLGHVPLLISESDAAASVMLYVWNTGKQGDTKYRLHVFLAPEAVIKEL